ncbi:hypothetical protein [Desulfobotulus alkaliphilus]|uniref:hypothetical protein n=1 Tax=Desulfobotulus alkaliphilus TaxID=622671 RepID=UPI001C97F289|nr:hypothetical protein [Desulfobotulus alkaliphilus]
MATPEHMLEYIVIAGLSDVSAEPPAVLSGFCSIIPTVFAFSEEWVPLSNGFPLKQKKV